MSDIRARRQARTTRNGRRIYIRVRNVCASLRAVGCPMGVKALISIASAAHVNSSTLEAKGIVTYCACCTRRTRYLCRPTEKRLWTRRTQTRANEKTHSAAPSNFSPCAVPTTHAAHSTRLRTRCCPARASLALTRWRSSRRSRSPLSPLL
jgi:hypothetical protein